MRGRELRRVAIVGGSSVIATLALAVSGLAGTQSQRVQVHRSGVVAAGTTDSVSAKCPRGYALTGGGYSTEYTELNNDFFPASPRRFTVAATNDHDVVSVLIDAYAVCHQAADRYKIVSKSVSVPDQEYRVARARCPKGTTVAGGGVRSRNDAPIVRIHQSRPSGPRVWLGEAGHFSASDPIEFQVFAICDKRAGEYVNVERSVVPPPEMMRGPAAKHRGTTVLVGARPRCPAGTKLSSGGFAMQGSTPNFRTFVNRPGGRRWLFETATYAGSDQRFTAYARCAKP